VPTTYKNYKLDDGTIMTVPELMKKMGMNRKQASYRLTKYSDPARIFVSVDTASNIEKMARDRIYASKPINDPMFRLMMMTI